MIAHSLPAEDAGFAQTTSPSHLASLRSRIINTLPRVLSPSLLLLVQRLGIASVFFLSGRTKVDGLFTITDSTYELFRFEYALPVIPPEIAAVMATVSEHVFSVLLIVSFLNACNMVDGADGLKRRRHAGLVREHFRVARRNAAPGSMRAEIGLLHLRVLRQRGGGARQHALADLKHGREVGNFEREFDRLLGKQDRQAFLVQAAEGFVHGFDDGRRKSE